MSTCVNVRPNRRPLIAVSSGRAPMRTAMGVVDGVYSTSAYADSVVRAGGLPVVVPRTDPPAPVDALAFDGLLLTGGGDIDPMLYGQRALDSTYDIDKGRDDLEIALLAEADAREIPVLALCRGMQLVNVVRGGTLVQHLPNPDRHWQKASPSAPTHDVTILSGTTLESVIGRTPITVNSFHHQSVDLVGSDLLVSATHDGVVEALESHDARIVAVQWHPEQLAPTRSAHAALFNHFVQRCVEHAATHSPPGDSHDPFR